MKFLLTAINAKYIHSNPAVYSLRAYADNYRENIEIAEYTINNRQEEILANIYKRKPDVIGFSCYIWNITVIKELITELHKIMPNLPIWLGGPEVSYSAKEILQELKMVTGVMIGEGEATFAELMRYYVENDMPLEEIKGICHKEGKTPDRELTDISKLPFLYENLELFTNRILYYESSRGCPFRCSYCLSSIEKQVRLRNLETVKKELQFFLDNKVKQVKFVDRTFNCNHDHAMTVWRYIKEHDNGVTNFHFEVSADIISEEEVELLNSMRPGLVQLEIGVQSTNPATIQAINRTMNLELLKRIVRKINEGNNIHQHLDLIAGLPYEDYTTFGKSFNEVYAMKPEQLQLGFLKVLKGSYMQEMAGEYGINYTSKPPYEVLYSKWLSYEEVRKLKAVEEMLELYYNSSQFAHILPVLEKSFHTPFAMYEEIAQFYEENGYFVNSPSRVYRYELLLQFAVGKDTANAELYRELLTYDMYLRENLKSRPSFMKDLSAQKERIKAFYQKEESKREILKSYRSNDAKQMSKMTHAELFMYPVWETDTERVCRKSEHEQILVFDYRIRNPLNQDAKTYLVTDETCC